MDLFRKTYHHIGRLSLIDINGTSGDSAGHAATLLEGYLGRPAGAEMKKRWATLSSSGCLNLYQTRASPEPYQSLDLQDFVFVQCEDVEHAFTLSSMIEGSVNSIRFVAYDLGSFRAWVQSFNKVYKNLEKRERSRASVGILRDSVFTAAATEFTSAEDTTMINQLLEHLETTLPTDPMTAAQTGGEPVAHSGHLQKRGNLNPSFKQRWFVLTELGRMIYFANQKSAKPLGQLALTAAEIIPCDTSEGAMDFSIQTNGRAWIFRCESNEDLKVWMTALNKVLQSRQQWGQLRRLSRTLASKVDARASSQGYAAVVNQSVPDPTISLSTAKLAIVTWNLGENFPDMEHLGFLQDLRSNDIIVVGVQEFQPVLAAVGLSARATPAHHHSVWEAMLASALGPRLAMAGSCAMGAVHVAVFTKRELLPAFSRLETGSIACGIGNLLSNKGAVAVKFDLCNTSLCFTCAHLCCGTEKVFERNSDFHRVDSELPLVLLNLDRASMYQYLEQRKSNLEPRTNVDGEKKGRKTRSMSIVDKHVAFRANSLVRQHGAEGEIGSEISMHDRLNGPDHTGLTSGLILDELMSRTSSASRLAAGFDYSFFFGDLNYRIAADGAWLRHCIKMSQELEELELLTTLPPPPPPDLPPPLPPADPNYSPRNEERCIPRESKELKVAVLLNSLANQELRRHSRACADGDNSEQGSQQDDDDVDSASQGQRSSNNSEDTDDDDDDDEDDDDEHNEGPAPHEIEDIETNGKEFDAIQVLRTLNIFDINDLQWHRERHTTDNIAIVSPEQLSDLVQRFQTVLRFVQRTGLRTANDVYNRLLKADQLTVERNRGAVLNAFSEPPITFRPSYKFDKYTQQYDTGKKNRPPAWCDRILYSHGTSNPMTGR